MGYYILIFVLIYNFPIFSIDLKNYQFYYLDSSFKSFIGPIDFKVKNKVFYTNWKKEKKEKKEKLFMIPSFCDAFSTLGTDREKNISEKIEQNFQSSLNHGFTHIKSLGDSKWIKNRIKKSEKIKPEIYFYTPILHSQNYLKDYTITSYHLVNSEKELFKKLYNIKKDKIYFIHKYLEDNPFNLNLYHINQIIKISKKEKFLPIIIAYGEYFSVLETINSGIPVLFHPIPQEISHELSPNNLEKLTWAPSFNLFYLQTLTPNADIHKLFDFSKKSPLLSKNTSLNLKINLEPELQKQANLEYKSYIKFFEQNKFLAKKMLLASSSGHINSFHGFSGWLELWILYSVLKDSSKIFQINKNTCQFISKTHSGSIKEKSYNNFIFLFTNPLKNFKNIFDIHSVFKNNKLVYFKN